MWDDHLPSFLEQRGSGRPGLDPAAYCLPELSTRRVPCGWRKVVPARR